MTWCLTDWLIHWLTAWLIDWLVNQIIESFMILDILCKCLFWNSKSIWQSLVSAFSLFLTVVRNWGFKIERASNVWKWWNFSTQGGAVRCSGIFAREEQGGINCATYSIKGNLSYTRPGLLQLWSMARYQSMSVLSLGRGIMTGM